MTQILVVDDVPAMAEQYAYDLKRVGKYDAIVAGLAAWGVRPTTHAQLATLVTAIFQAARPGDLIAFIGHTGMEPAVGMLRDHLRSTGRQGRRRAASFIDEHAQLRTSAGRPLGDVPQGRQP